MKKDSGQATFMQTERSQVGMTFKETSRRTSFARRIKMENQNPVLDTSHEFPKPPFNLPREPQELPPPKQNRNIFLFGILAFIVLIGIGGYMLGMQNKPASQVTAVPTQSPVATSIPTPTIDVITNWKTYANSIYNFSIQYPQNWNILPDSKYHDVTFLSPEKIQFVEGSEPPITPIRIVIDNTPIQNQIDILKKTYNYDNFKDEVITINGINVRKISGIVTEESYVKGDYNIEAFIQKNNSVIEISYLNRENVTQDLFDQILSTFKFTNTQAVTDYYSCKTDSDCITVDGGACGCNEGGNATTVNKENVGVWSQKLMKDREGIACPQYISQDSSCKAAPKCVQNKCLLIP